jgi:hypothetical protein
MKTDDEFLTIFRQLVIAFQPRALDKGTADVYRFVLGQLPADVLRASAQRLMRTSTFFPTTGEWHRAAQAMLDEQELAAAPHPSDPIECEACDDTGWVFVTERGVIPCSCRHTNGSYQRRQAASIRRRRDDT